MAEAQPALNPAAQAALRDLADVAMPAPAAWTPQTWGWAVLAVVVLAAVAWTYVRWRRRREANRYRVEALTELAALEAQLAGAATRGPALAAIPPLLKRTALAAWRRAEVASLSGASWVAFLREHAGGDAIADAAARLLDDSEYRSHESLAAVTADEALACARAARAWIERHRVPA